MESEIETGWRLLLLFRSRLLTEKNCIRPILKRLHDSDLDWLPIMPLLMGTSVSVL